MRLLPLTRGAFALVDDEDYPLVSKFTWHLQGATGQPVYAGTKVAGNETILLHRLIMAPPPDMQVDHISGLTLDNRRSNLRICTAAENAQNRRPSGRCSAKKRKGSFSEFKGVSDYTYTGKSGTRQGWRASISVGGNKKHLGVFAAETEAARAYDTAAKQFFGPFARLNFPDVEKAA